jgi:hypothetical protein
MVLDKEVPETVISLPLFILLKKHDLEINDIDHLIFILVKEIVLKR